MLSDSENAQRSLANQLPSELLAFIFQIAVDAQYPRDIFDSANYGNPAATLVHVCSRWRQVALDSRSLWSCVVFPYWAGRDYGRSSIITQLQLERTRGSQIDLFLSHKPPHDLGNPDFQSTLDLIKPYIKQLRSLAARLHEIKDIESLLELCLTNGTAGSLSRLEIFGDLLSPLLFQVADSETHRRMDDYLQSVRVLKLRGTTFGWESAVFEHLDELVLSGVAMENDPEAVKVKGWRHSLQRAFLNGAIPTRGEMAGLDILFTTIEQYDKMSVEYLAYSKIAKIIRKIGQIIEIPSDNQYHFRQRSQALFRQWLEILNASEDRVLLQPPGPAP